MGKYTHLRSKFPQHQRIPDWFKAGHEKWAARVDAVKRELLGSAENPEDASRERLAAMLANAKREKASIEASLHAVNTRIEALNQILKFQLQEESTEKVKLSNGLTIGLKDEVYVSVKDRAKFFAYIKETKQTNLLSVAYQTTKALVSELALAGKKPPPGVEICIITSVGLYGVKGYEESAGE